MKLLLYISWRYFAPPKGSGRRSGVLLAIFGVAIGVLAMVTVLAVMNGLQQGYIQTILEMESGHLQYHAGGRLTDTQLDTIEQLAKDYGLVHIHPMAKQTTLLRSLWGDYEAVQLLGIDSTQLSGDDKFLEKVHLVNGHLPQKGEILLGQQLAFSLGVDVGSTIVLMVLAEGSDEPFEIELTIRGLFESGYYAFDAGMAMMDLTLMMDLLGSERTLFYQFKLLNAQKSLSLAHHLRQQGFIVNSWQEYNKAFFAALELEKTLIVFMLQLIFIVTAINIYQSRRRMIYEKQLESFILRTIGMQRGALHAIFTLQASFIGVIGAMLGVGCGLLIVWQINTLVIYSTLLLNQVLSLFGVQVYMLFDSAIFYLSEIPTQVMLQDMMLIIFSALLITTASGYLAGRSLIKERPTSYLD